MEKAQYKTRQKQLMLEYLESVPGEHVTVHDIVTHFAGKGIQIGTTTVYRHLEKLVEEGLVKKYLIEQGAAACFEYINPAENCHKTNCFHLKCTGCGKLIHLHCEDLEAIETHIFEHHNFLIDPRRTVFYGLCQNCRD